MQSNITDYLMDAARKILHASQRVQMVVVPVDEAAVLWEQLKHLDPIDSHHSLHVWSDMYELNDKVYEVIWEIASTNKQDPQIMEVRNV